MYNETDFDSNRYPSHYPIRDIRRVQIKRAIIRRLANEKKIIYFVNLKKNSSPKYEVFNIFIY